MSETMSKIAGKSWRTTIAGVLASVAIIASNAAAVFDNDPATVLDATKLIHEMGLIAAAFGLIAARDNGVTSEQAGAK